MSRRSPLVLAGIFVAAGVAYVVLSVARGREVEVTLVLLTGVAAVAGWLILTAPRRGTGSR